MISSDPYSPIGDSLARSLTRAHTQPAAPTDEHVATLRIVSENWSEGPLSVDAFSHVREDIVVYSVKFAFTSADGRDVSSLQEAKLQRDFVYDDSHALGTSEEQGAYRAARAAGRPATTPSMVGDQLSNGTAAAR